MKAINCHICGAIRWGNSRYLNKACVCKYCRKKNNNLIKKGVSIDQIIKSWPGWKTKKENMILKENMKFIWKQTTITLYI